MQKRKQILKLLSPVGPRQSVVLGITGGVIFFLIWEIGHYVTPAESKRFLPSPQHVLSTLYTLIVAKDFLSDIGISLFRIIGSFAAVCIVATPLGIFMGCFDNMRALINPVVSGARYLPAASFIPLLLVWFGPTDTQKMALLFLGVIFFLIALILDNVRAVQKELIEAALTMGASRRQIVFGVVARAASPAILDSMRNMIAVGWTYLVIAEIVAAQDGIGAVMMRAGRFLKADVIMAGILTIGVLGVLTDIAFRVISYYAVPWNRKRSE
ncbi:MAG: ABC transporter permease [Acidiferrobacterales bacterium]|nr:ABC transporter permease [Acidiferrobacterales bacterium]